MRLRALIVSACVLLPAAARAGEDLAVPMDLQASLLAKVAAYDRNLPARAGGTLRILIVTKPGDADSGKAATRLTSELGAAKTIANLPVEVSTVPFGGSAALVEACKSKQISIVYLAPGLGADVPSIGKGLEGADVLSVAAVADYVQKGAVLGFDLVSGKPQLVVQLAQANRQNVKFAAEVLRLMKVYQ